MTLPVLVLLSPSSASRTLARPWLSPLGWLTSPPPAPDCRWSTSYPLTREYTAERLGAWLSTDIDPTKPGIQMTPGATVHLAARITDDVQVRNVELLLDGTVVRNDVSYPYELSARLPVVHCAGHRGGSEQAARRHGGTLRLSDAIRIELVPDSRPRSSSSTTRPTAVKNRRLSAGDSSILRTTRPGYGGGGELRADRAEWSGTGGFRCFLRRDHTTLSVRLPRLFLGDYQFIIHAAALTDRSGNARGPATNNLLPALLMLRTPARPHRAARRTAARLRATCFLRWVNCGAVADFNRDGLLDVAGPLVMTAA